ncbi:MAG TPA: phage tail protein [Gaiellaceae bacterium]|nr:phage tail protein [Gaiellaceae bacterium]
MPQRRDDPYLNFNFRVEIDGLQVAGFSEAQLPEGRIEVVAYREGGENTSAPRLLPGRVEFGPVVLRRGFAGDPALFQWWNDVVQGHVARRNVVIILLDEQRQEVARWVIRRAWPSKWTGPDLRGLGNEVSIETLELTHEGIELDD